MVLLVTVGVIDLVKGLDVEEAVISWAVAAVLIRWRAAFWVHHDAGHATTAVRRVVARTVLTAGWTSVTGAAVAPSRRRSQ